jgi:hypothetical protein
VLVSSSLPSCKEAVNSITPAYLSCYTFCSSSSSRLVTPFETTGLWG